MIFNDLHLNKMLYLLSPPDSSLFPPPAKNQNKLVTSTPFGDFGPFTTVVLKLHATLAVAPSLRLLTLPALRMCISIFKHIPVCLLIWILAFRLFSNLAVVVKWETERRKGPGYTNRHIPYQHSR